MNFLSTLSKPLQQPQLSSVIASQGKSSASKETQQDYLLEFTVTPELAQEWLKKNTHNRPLSDGHVLEIAQDMVDGRWQYNHSPILFGRDGVLLDGQYRLTACTLAKVPFVTDVYFNCDPRIMESIDIGKARRASDIAHLSGVENSTGACAIAALLLIHEDCGITGKNNPLNRARVTKARVVDRVKSDAFIQHSYRRGRELIKMTTAVAAGFCYYLFAKQNQVLADRFFDELKTGENLPADSPSLLLRNRLLENKASKAKLADLHIFALYFRAWGAYRAGKKLKILKTWRTDGATPESFPAI